MAVPTESLVSNWRDAILNEPVPKVSKPTLVADPDSLLAEEKLALELHRRGFDLIEFKGPVEFSDVVRYGLDDEMLKIHAAHG